MEVVLAILVLFLYLRGILILLVYPWQALTYKSWKKHYTLDTVLSLPYKVILKLTISGWDKFSAVHISRLPSKHLRRWANMGLGADFGKDVVLRYQAEVWNPYALKIGEGSIIGYNNLLDARNGIMIGRYVNFSANVSVYTEQHDYRDPMFACNKTDRKVVEIGDRVWIGPNVIILPGVKIGEGAVCAAGCVVTKDIEPFAVVAGIPAKKVNVRPHNMVYEFHGVESRIY